MRRRIASTAILAWVLAAASASAADENRGYKEAGGLAVYLGVLPAAMVQGHQAHPEETMHGGVPRGRHAFHVLAAVFNAASGERIEDAAVEARVTPLGLAGVTRVLEPMTIAGTVTYGNYFAMSETDPYRIEFSITTAGATRPVAVEFSYTHSAP